ncbi:acyl-phosphate glycerol 3-phosphate acyltransferase [Pasteurellaceae bacterium RH1A]|nr:acyl-phosphate glycerol 3-phosphate acyltransferase [Pasteurellaceae bacterium RH1A]
MAEKLDYARRFVATALGFAFWGVAGLLFQLYLYPYAKNHRTNSLETQLKIRRLVGKIWAIFTRYLVWAGVLEVEYKGFDKLGRKGQLVLANHPSLLDVVLIIGKQPDFNCIVKQDLLNNPTMRNQILACGFLPNTESLELLEQCDEVLKEQALLLFPEGTRTGWDGVIKLNRGAVSIGLRSATVITPITVKMQPLNFKKGQPWYQLPSKRIRYEITVGEDIDPQTWLAEKPLPIASRRLTHYLEDYFNSQTQGQ